MRPLLALLVILPSLCLAQGTDELPLDGLVAWFSFDSTYCDDISGLCFTPNSEVGFQQDESSTAIELSGGFLEQEPRPDLNLQTFSILIRCKALPPYKVLLWKGSPEYPIDVNFYLLVGSESPIYFDASPECSEAIDWSINDNEGYLAPQADWNTVLVTRNNQGIITMYNGTSSIEYQGSSICDENAPMRIGRWWDGGPGLFLGLVDYLGIWNRALNEDEVATLFPSGCTNPEACNYDAEAQIDNGSCIDCTHIPQFCGEGTAWDSTLQQCVSIAPPCAPSCGEGTVWDPVNEECIIAIPADLNYDGCVSVNDLLLLLAVHGTCPPYPDWPDEPTDTTWACGNPIPYHGYDYATVQIGNQCWFAENLRTTTYSNGDSIPSGLDDSAWSTTTEGATAVMGEGNSSCIGTGSTYDACNPYLALLNQGRLYNLYVLHDERGVCPLAWKVPSESDWQTLEVTTGLPWCEANSIGYRGSIDSVGYKMKSVDKWIYGQGSNEVGLNALPGGYRDVFGNYTNDGTTGPMGFFWTNSPSGWDDFAWFRLLSSSNAGIRRDDAAPRNGFSVRCVKD